MVTCVEPSCVLSYHVACFGRRASEGTGLQTPSRWVLSYFPNDFAVLNHYITPARRAVRFVSSVWMLLNEAGEETVGDITQSDVAEEAVHSILGGDSVPSDEGGVAVLDSHFGIRLVGRTPVVLPGTLTLLVFVTCTITEHYSFHDIHI